MLVVCLILSAAALSAQPNRITGRVDASRTRALQGSLHHLAQPQFDRGAVDPAMPMRYMMLLVKPSGTQQAALDRFLADQQNPSSPQFHKWLTPEQFGGRFGLSASDHSKVVAWLASEGFTIDESARGRNWVAFSGSAGQVSKSLHTSIRRFEVNGETHFANNSEPSVPEALSDVVGGITGLHDFRPQSMARIITQLPPDFNSGTVHYLAPEDWATIYDVGPLSQAGIDGTGQSIVVVGESDVLASDLSTFRTRYNLPANPPKMILYGGADPGYNGAELEGNLDLEWAGAIAPKATIYYVYGADAFAAMVYAVSQNLAPVITVSYGECEVNDSASYYRPVAQQANAQGITILNSSGDSGGAGCDQQGSEPLAARGRSVDFPAVMPEVTGVGGTQFVEGAGTYWASTNDANGGSALSYIPEAAWNESGTSGIGASGGGVSNLYSRPVWQTGPGVPNDNFRHVPDISLSAAGHDGYLVYYVGGLDVVGGTSCSSPSMAGILALLNQYQVSKGYQAKAGLGNINPQLYRLAQSAPAAFHDIVNGTNVVQCAQGTPDCLTGQIGYSTGPGYDMATGLGSIDANNFVTQWNTATNAVTITLAASAAKGTLNDTDQLTATVTAASGSATPTGTVNFAYAGLSGGIPLGSAALSGTPPTASVTIPLSIFQATGTFTVSAQYSGDAAFSAGGVSTKIQVTNPLTGAAILVSGPSAVWPPPPPYTGLSWQTTLILREAAGVPAKVTGLTIDGLAQPLAQYFPSTDIPASGTLSSTFNFTGLATPVTRVFGFTGIDVTGQTWARRISVDYYSLPEWDNFNLAATPLVVTQNTTADPACQWAVQLNADDVGGFLRIITGLYAGDVYMLPQVPSIFGTTRLNAFADIQGTMCFGGITPPVTIPIEMDLSNGNIAEVTVTLTGPPANPTKLSATPAAIAMQPSGSPFTTATLTVGIADQTQAWSASIFPANRTTGWLTASPLSGVGPGQITLIANGSGFEQGAYQATIILQSANAIPQTITVPVMFVMGASASGPAIGSVVDAATYQAGGAPGMVASVFGTNLTTTTLLASARPLPYSLGGLTATVNGMPAALMYVSPTQVNLQIPYEASAGPAVLGITNTNTGQAAGFAFPLAPAAPRIFNDGSGNANPTVSVPQGGAFAVYVTGTGEVSPALKSAYSPTAGTPLASLPKPLLPLSATVGGVPAFIQFVGITPGLIGTMQVNLRLPASVPAGVQPVVITVGGVASPPVNVTVTAAP